MKTAPPDEILWRHLRELPYFRAMVRAVEDSFYQDIELPAPVLDLGCGDGHFASVAFDHPLDVGLDPWWGPLLEARTRNAYRLLLRADGARIPVPDGSFASVVSNSVLEHIPHLDQVLAEVARVLRPGGRFVFCVPNHRFPNYLWGTQTFNRLGLKAAADGYGRFFNRISRHQHTDSYTVWKKRMDQSGFRIEKHWDYFPAGALHRMEVGHALGLPALVSKKLTGRWILSQSQVNLWLPWQIAKDVFHAPLSQEGVYSFYITRRLED